MSAVKANAHSIVLVGEGVLSVAVRPGDFGAPAYAFEILVDERAQGGIWSLAPAESLNQRKHARALLREPDNLGCFFVNESLQVETHTAW